MTAGVEAARELDGGIDRRESVGFYVAGIHFYSRAMDRTTPSNRTTAGSDRMNDTSPEVATVVAERYRQMTPLERMKIASDMFDTARAIIESSLLENLSRRERRLALAKRLYGNELPEAALIEFSEWQHTADRPKTDSIDEI